ncbi:MAG TPA: Xaa-Pro peptidase family protein [Verrucomicrobiae bacterium]|nr:Xaa-Pro peptidase family protein [Verrucomicrobiae bacterium]
MDRLRALLPGIGADVLLVSLLPNIRYLCGFTGSAALLLVESSRSSLFTDSRYTLQAREEVSGTRIHIAKHGLIGAVAETLRSHKKPVRVGYSPHGLTIAQKKILDARSGTGIRWIPDGNIVEGLRAVKDADELETMRDAANLITRVFCDLIRNISTKMSEIEVAAEIEYKIKRYGGSGPSFDTIVASGPRSAWPHAKPTSKLLGKSQFVVLDHGAIIRGYCSDMTRTVFLGKATKAVKETYAAVLEAQAAAREALRPGVRAGVVDAAARGVLKRFKLDKYFTHSTGHGLGLEVHEMPRLGQNERTIMREGMVVTVEPGVYISKHYGVRIEDEVVVTAAGAVNLTTAPREFLEL